MENRVGLLLGKLNDVNVRNALRNQHAQIDEDIEPLTANLRVIVDAIMARAISLKDLPQAMVAQIDRTRSALQNWLVSGLLGNVVGELRTLRMRVDQTFPTILLLIQERIAARAQEQAESLAQTSKLEAEASSIIAKSKKDSQSVARDVVAIGEQLQTVVTAREAVAASSKAVSNFEKEIGGKAKQVREITEELVEKRELARTRTKSTLTALRRAQKAAALAETRLSETHQRVELELARIDATNKQAEEAFFVATTTVLARTWHDYRTAAESQLKKHFGALKWLVGLGICASVWLVFAIQGRPGATSMIDAVGVKSIALAPLVFAIWFVAAQYNETNRRIRLFLSLESMAKTLDAYQRHFENAAGEDNELKSEVARQFLATVDKMYASILSLGQEVGEGDPLVSIGKKRYTIEEIVSIAERVATRVPPGGAN